MKKKKKNSEPHGKEGDRGGGGGRGPGLGGPQRLEAPAPALVPPLRPTPGSGHRGRSGAQGKRR